jgi:hypothetical protein
MLKKGTILNLDIGKVEIFSGIKKFHIILVKISPFKMKRFDINKTVQYETFFQ